MRWIATLRGLGLTIAEIRQLTNAQPRRSFGHQLADRLRASRQRLQVQISQLEETLHRVDEFETAYQADLPHEDASCRDGDPRCPIEAQQPHR